VKPAEGIALGDRYRLGTRIAVGGMGEVWAAHDTALGRDVAVKVLREEFAGDAGFLERFRTEARNSAQLSHPNIAALYDYGEQEGSAFLVMELILGEPMSDLLDRQPVLPTRRLLPILAQTARALHAAHVAGVVHRDVKPGNIIVARTGQVKITDFGISTAINQVPMTASGMVMGTAQYLSPEQAMGRAATPASDMYSLGIVAYEALVGHRPFTGATAVDIAIAHVNTAVPPLPGSIDPVLADLVMRMLAKDPQARPRSAASLARHLDDMLDKTPSDGVPLAQGRHARPVDVVDADEHAAATGPSSGGTAGTPVGTAAATPPAAAPAARPAVPPVVPPAAPPAPPSGPEVAAGQVTPVAGADRSVQVDASAVPLEATPVYAAALEEGRRTAARRAARPDRTGTDAGSADRVVGPSSAGGAGGGTDAASSSAVRRVSTSTGRRWGPVSHPFLALVLMVIFALLGAAFADSLWGPSRAGGPPPGTAVLASASPSSAHQDGMIHSAPGAPGPTTTARDL
jgi:serine/threonine-protein kinase